MALLNTYVPSSMSKSYVESKRTPEGTRGYLQAEQELDIQKQSALQSLEKEYSSAIENAYASYLSNQRSIGLSKMGEGYKQLYRQMQEQELASNIAQTNLSTSKARQELGLQTEEAKSQLEQTKQAEISNLNRVQNTMQQYLDYVKSMQETEGIQLLTEEQQNMYIDDLYETLYNLPVTGTNVARYSDWIRSNLTGSKEDTAWGDWLYSGGLQDFMNAVKQTRQLETKPKELKEYNSNKIENKNVVHLSANDVNKNYITTDNGDKYVFKSGRTLNNLLNASGDYTRMDRSNAYYAGSYIDDFKDINTRDEWEEITKTLIPGTIYSGKDKTFIYLRTAKSGYPLFEELIKQ